MSYSTGTFQILRKYVSYRILEDVGKLLLLNPGTILLSKDIFRKYPNYRILEDVGNLLALNPKT